MAQESTFAPLEAFYAEHAPLIDCLQAEANCSRWGLSRNRFAEALRRSAEKRYGGVRTSAAEAEAYLKSLHLEDLALACACGEGVEAVFDAVKGVSDAVSGYAGGSKANARYEIVSTGTLTKAMPVVPGETWTATPTEIALDAIQLRFS